MCEHSILEIKNLCKSYKNFTLNNINLSLDKGFIMGLIGENGAGKTTLIKLIINLVKPNSGSIEVFGKDNIKFESDVKEKIGFVYDELNLYSFMSVKDNIALVSSLYSSWDSNAFNSYMQRFGISQCMNQKFKDLSKGMKMKLSLCIALSHKAEFIILDEPTSGLDPVVRSELLEELQTLVENQNVSILISTHITTDLDKIADYITFLSNGNMVFSLSNEELRENYKVVKGPLAALTEDLKALFLGVSKNKYGFEALTNSSDKLCKFIKSHSNDSIYNDLIIENAQLEDIMFLHNIAS
ncbi:ABC-2 type transport system ATP-binding protein [Hathewaya proteolytica DSM 3090]|uniref:ABC-2 type transport system ATP-binding protein n=1 Tax=Hathewaya proteolytica DSM 3090 TaxID=1121331 RepID=A0A1M6S719_9CLOT|nr:ABC transporter ATP-binding protein [Hathewaya proteolytica]SHK40348.1 ABC-2 type transport system ATP-binding protein [Hathewaya proteolytica DSM 3090]